MEIIASRKEGIKGRKERFIQSVYTYTGTFFDMDKHEPTVDNVKVVNARSNKDITYKYNIEVR